MGGQVDEVEGVYTGGSSIIHTHAKDGVSLAYYDTEAFYHKFAEFGLAWPEKGKYSKEMPLGEGSVRWDKYLKALVEVGYDGFLTIEREVTNGAEDIRTAVGFLEKQLAKL